MGQGTGKGHIKIKTVRTWIIAPSRGMGSHWRGLQRGCQGMCWSAGLNFLDVQYMGAEPTSGSEYKFTRELHCI